MSCTICEHVTVSTRDRSCNMSGGELNSGYMRAIRRYMRTSVKATAKPSLLLSLGLASPRINLRKEYDTSCAFNASSPSDFLLSPPSSSSSSSDVSGDSFGTKFDWKCSSAATSFTEASRRSFLLADERCQKRGRVVDMTGAASLAVRSPPATRVRYNGFQNDTESHFSFALGRSSDGSGRAVP